MQYGIFPTNLLNGRDIFLIDERLPKDCGILPVRLFARSASVSSFFKEPNSAGIFPLSPFQLKFMILALEQLDKMDGTSPSNVLLLRYSSCSRNK